MKNLRSTTAGALAQAAVALGFLVSVLPRSAEASVVEKIAALVGDDVILLSEVEDRAAPLLSEIAAIANPGERDARSSAARREVLDRLIDDQLLSQQATELKLNVGNEEIDRAIEQYLALADTYYQLASIDKAREKYIEALKLAPRGGSVTSA